MRNFHTANAEKMIKRGMTFMKSIPLYMYSLLKTIPESALPVGFQFRLFQAGDENHWARINVATEEFSGIGAAMQRFNQEFGPYLAEVKKRMLFILNEEEMPIGTATAWFGEWEGKVIGRLHWVEIIPEYQGKGLGAPLISKAIELLAVYHDEAYLKTQTTSQAAIHLYEKLGFEPAILSEEEKEGWSLIKAANQSID